MPQQELMLSKQQLVRKVDYFTGLADVFFRKIFITQLLHTLNVNYADEPMYLAL